MIDEEAFSAALRAAMLANPDLGATDNDALTAFCDAIAAAVAQFCEPVT
jgi:hypothetical protein